MEANDAFERARNLPSALACGENRATLKTSAKYKKTSRLPVSPVSSSPGFVPRFPSPVSRFPPVSKKEGGPQLPSRLYGTRTALDLETRLAFAEEPVNRSVFR